MLFLWYSDILYLNKQRLVAVEELNKANGEKQLLLDRIERLEAEKQAGVGKGNSGLKWLKQWVMTSCSPM